MKTLLRIFCVIFAVAVICSSGLVYASENNQGSADQSEQLQNTADSQQKEIHKGWNTIDGYRYYYTAKKKKVTGWKKIRGKYYYFHKTQTQDAPKGSMATGFLHRNGKVFFFSKSGILQTGWTKVKGNVYFFAKKGGPDYLGEMYTGLKKMNGKRFYFDADGILQTGFQTVNGKTYYFETGTKFGLRGKAATGWKTIGEYTYYFNKKGVLQKNKWISKKYYVDADGHLLKKTITPDGFFVNKYGIKTESVNGWKKLNGKYYYLKSGKIQTGWQKVGEKTYYLGEDGVRRKGFVTVDGARYYLKKGVVQTGLVSVSGKKYYFDSEGKMLTDTIVGGITIGADGVADMSSKIPAILIVAGHGMGDVGAKGVFDSGTIYEAEYTRQFANLLKAKLDASGAKLSVTMYDQDYDLYQVHAGRKPGPVPELTMYDYVLEIHFNATIESMKDSKGDGDFKGVGMYINTARTGIQLDKDIVKAVASTGFRIWGGGTGVFKSATLLNARTCQEKGVPYGLLETAFIDDKDDMKFYNKNKAKMAQAAADAIVSYFKKMY